MSRHCTFIGEILGSSSSDIRMIERLVDHAVMQLRNLRARVEGVVNVAQEWWKWKAEEK